jgi:phosphatidylglycerophosphatase A
MGRREPELYGPAGRVAGVGRRDRLAVVLGSFGMSGFFPVAPATFTSAVAAVLLAWAYPLASPGEYTLLVAALFAAGVWACGRMEHRYGRDPSAAVLDEVCGMAIALAAVPISAATVALGFALFRIFDILKLPPGRRLERLPGGWGIMLDDVVAGAYAALALRILLRVWPEPRFAAWHLVPVGALALLGLVFRRPLMRRYGKPRTRLGPSTPPSLSTDREAS